jgi:hypothetical protein
LGKKKKIIFVLHGEVNSGSIFNEMNSLKISNIIIAFDYYVWSNFQFELAYLDAQAVDQRDPRRRDGVGQNDPDHLLLGSSQGNGRRGPESHHRTFLDHG